MLTGKTALVTGSAKGLGRRTALELAASGCDVALNYVTSREEAEKVAAEIAAMGRKAVAIGAGAGKWWGWALTGFDALLLVVFTWEAASRSEFEKIRANDPGTTRYSWVVNWLTFFALPALFVLLWGLAANLGKR